MTDQETSTDSIKTAAQQIQLNTAEPEISENLRLFVCNLPFRFNDKDLLNLFSCYGAVNAQINYNDRGSRGFGFVQLQSIVDFEKARSEMNGIVIDGRRVEVRRATKLDHDKGKKTREMSSTNNNADAQFKNEYRNISAQCRNPVNFISNLYGNLPINIDRLQTVNLMLSVVLKKPSQYLSTDIITKYAIDDDLFQCLSQHILFMNDITQFNIDIFNSRKWPEHIRRIQNEANRYKLPNLLSELNSNSLFLQPTMSPYIVSPNISLSSNLLQAPSYIASNKHSIPPTVPSMVGLTKFRNISSHNDDNNNTNVNSLNKSIITRSERKDNTDKIKNYNMDINAAQLTPQPTISNTHRKRQNSIQDCTATPEKKPCT